MTCADERRALVALSLIPGLGPGRIRRLITYLGSPARALSARPRILAAVPGIGERIARSIVTFDRFDLVEEQFRLANRVGGRLIVDTDAEYPALLKEIYDPPPLLWVRGRFIERDRQSVAIVGTRKATSYGRHIAASLASGLVERGFTVVSGLAYGIDTAAHLGAIEAGGRSVAVLGSGIDRIYPNSNRTLALRLIESGCVASEQALGTPPDAPNFPRRNRIISGMSLGTIVVEAFEEGGALITARLACEQNREVFAVPSAVTRPGGPGSGCNRLIQRGHAKLVMTVEDVIAEFPFTGLNPDDFGTADSRPVTPDLRSPEELLLWKVLEYQPIHLDTICSKSELEPSTALVHLLNLEFRGLVRQLAGKQFVRN